jgi:energy-coupling factor transporter ATP-binding protein EcfA2
MRWWPEEPAVTAWEPVDDSGLRTRVQALLPLDRAPLILVDGRSGGGKSTFAAQLAGLVDATVVHTDDIAWHHHPIDWAELLVSGVLDPWRRGELVAFRPPAWVARDRPGAVEAPAGRGLVVEGVGASRAELAPHADLAVWVQSDPTEARRRGLARDVVLGRSPEQAEAFWDEWARSEDPFIAADRPWTRARLIVNGTPPQRDPSDTDVTWVADGPLD